MIEQYLVPCKMRAVYMAVTDDAYELPIAIGDSCRELGRIIGLDPGEICRLVNGKRKGVYKKGREFVRVYVEDDSRDENKNGNLPG